MADLVGDLDPDGIAAGQGSDHAHRRYAQIEREVIGEVSDLIEPQAGFECDLVLRDDRPGVDADHLDRDAEVEAGLLQ